jgi:hypothetical protein
VEEITLCFLAPEPSWFPDFLTVKTDGNESFFSWILQVKCASAAIDCERCLLFEGHGFWGFGRAKEPRMEKHEERKGRCCGKDLVGPRK